MTHRILITPTALRMLRDIGDRQLQRKIRERIEGLAQDPHSQGRLLQGEMTGIRSIHAVGQQPYRILFQADESQVFVVAVAVGARAGGDKTDVHMLAKKLFRLRLLDLKEFGETTPKGQVRKII